MDEGVRLRHPGFPGHPEIDEQGPDVPLRDAGRPSDTEESELTRLRRELAEAKEELAILKMFCACQASALGPAIRHR